MYGSDSLIAAFNTFDRKQYFSEFWLYSIGVLIWFSSVHPIQGEFLFFSVEITTFKSLLANYFRTVLIFTASSPWTEHNFLAFVYFYLLVKLNAINAFNTHFLLPYAKERINDKNNAW